LITVSWTGQLLTISWQKSLKSSKTGNEDYT
jgi:hypothetical protein